MGISELYPQLEPWLAGFQALLVMIAMGTNLRLGDFATVFGHPRSLLAGLSWQLVVAPLLTIGLILIWPMAPGITVGLLMIAAMPGGPLANLFCHLAKGNVALSIALTTLGTLATIGMAPLLLSVVAGPLLPETVAIPAGEIIQNTLLFVVTPLMAGMIFGRVAPRASQRIAQWFVRASVAILFVMVLGSISSGRIEPLSYGWSTPIAIILLCLVFQNGSMLLFHVCRWPVADQTAIGVGLTIRNVNLALLLAAQLFPATSASAGTASIGGGVIYVTLFWGAVSLICCTPTLFIQPRLFEKEQKAKRAHHQVPTAAVSNAE